MRLRPITNGLSHLFPAFTLEQHREDKRLGFGRISNAVERESNQSTSIVRVMSDYLGR